MKTRIVAGILGALFSFGQAQAFVIGDQVLVSWLYPDQGTSYWDSSVITVSDAVELPNIADLGVLDVNISDESPELAFDFTNTTSFFDTSFNGFFIQDFSSSIADFLDVTIADTNLEGFDASRIFFSSEAIYINFSGIAFNNQSYIDFDIDFESVSVPEPGTLLLFGIGIAGIAGVRARKKLS